MSEVQRYEARSVGSGATVVKPYASYRKVLEDARIYAFRAATEVVVIDSLTGDPIVIVNARMQTRPANRRYRS